jgi:prolipoprotein diacylglyceryltransferase
VRGVILVSLENASFHMVYTINWFKKCQHINYCSHAEQLTFNCHKGGGAYHGTVVYFVIFRCCFFPWYKGSLRENYIYALVVEGDNSRVTRRNPGEYKYDQQQQKNNNKKIKKSHPYQTKLISRVILCTPPRSWL